MGVMRRRAGQALAEVMRQGPQPTGAGRIDVVPPAVNPWLAAAGGGSATAAAFWGALALMAKDEEERKQLAEKESQLALQ